MGINVRIICSHPLCCKWHGIKMCHHHGVRGQSSEQACFFVVFCGSEANRGSNTNQGRLPSRLSLFWIVWGVCVCVRLPGYWHNTGVDLCWKCNSNEARGAAMLLPHTHTHTDSCCRPHSHIQTPSASLLQMSDAKIRGESLSRLLGFSLLSLNCLYVHMCQLQATAGLPWLPC